MKTIDNLNEFSDICDYQFEMSGRENSFKSI